MKPTHMVSGKHPDMTYCGRWDQRERRYNWKQVTCKACQKRRGKQNAKAC